MSTPESLTGVVAPELPDMPQAASTNAYEDAQKRVGEALTWTQERLRELRKQREQTNAEIKQLVDDEELLIRMSRVRKGARRDG